MEKYRDRLRVNVTCYSITWSLLKSHVEECSLTPILLMWRIWWATNNASKWQMGFNLTFKWFNALRMVAYRQPQGTVWRITSAWYKDHPALKGFSLPYIVAMSSCHILAFNSNNTLPTTASQDHCTKLTYLIYNRQCTLSFPLYGLRSLSQTLHLQAISGLKKRW